MSKDGSPEWLAALEKASTADVWLHGFGLMHLASGLVIGTASFTGPTDAEGIVEIAYGIVPDYQGQGYATEAAEALVAYAQSSGRIRIVRAHTLPKRNASTRILEKCAFRRLAELTDPVDGLVWRWERQVEAR